MSAWGKPGLHLWAWLTPFRVFAQFPRGEARFPPGGGHQDPGEGSFVLSEQLLKQISPGLWQSWKHQEWSLQGWRQYPPIPNIFCFQRQLSFQRAKSKFYFQSTSDAGEGGDRWAVAGLAQHPQSPSPRSSSSSSVSHLPPSIWQLGKDSQIFIWWWKILLLVVTVLVGLHLFRWDLELGLLCILQSSIMKDDPVPGILWGFIWCSHPEMFIHNTSKMLCPIRNLVLRHYH